MKQSLQALSKQERLDTWTRPIILYDYQPNRKAENAEAFLNGFEGWLHADGYQGYHDRQHRISP